ncbi:MAG: MBL fold metallo-hydrolase [Desulfuromonas sp.]|nr:MBL fold metallo-hydrolase [Desulfuromonas sp.]
MHTNSSPIILHHGGAAQVTGSCHELFCHDGESILVDCGLFQGAQVVSPQIDFSIKAVRALIVTHVHLDHVGRIPYLLAAGFSGPIYCSRASAALLPVVLEDALKVGVTRNRQLISKALKRLQCQIVAVEMGRWLSLDGLFSSSVSIKFQPAGHILGSAYIQIRLGSGERGGTHTGDHRQVVVFSGDLGAPYAPLLSAPKSPWRADTLILESTYGDRLHEQRRFRRRHLQQAIERALENRGVILIPAFSIGRTQELLYELETLIHGQRNRSLTNGMAWDDLEVVVDSPLAARFTELYQQLRSCWDREGHARLRQGRHPLSFQQITTIDSHEEHLQTVRYLKKKARPCIVIAASGMCTGGRIVDYLKALLGDERTDILFVGYQGEGTAGREIQTYGPRGGYVMIDGHRYTIKAGVTTLSGYSAHADQSNLLNFIRRMRHRPRRVLLVHGEKSGREGLREKINGEFPEIDVILPRRLSDNRRTYCETV